MEKPKVAVIDDERDLVETIKNLLESRGFAVSVAYDGKSGLELVKSEKPDIVILDITMPLMDGRDVLVQLKKSNDTKDIPIIMLTARGEQYDRTYGLELGADEYLPKPYSGRVLLRQIDHILEKKNKKELS